MADWVVWLVLAGGLMIAELLTLTFVLGLLSAAAAITAITGVLDLPVAAQIATFGVSSAILFVLVKPFERRHRMSPAITTGVAALTGRKGVVTEELTQRSGRVKVGGESWAARLQTAGPALDVGAPVIVAEVDGATLVVFPEEF